MIAFAAWLLAFASTIALPTTKGLHRLETDVPGVGRVRYAVSLPDGFDPRTPTPLALVLHPGGARIPYYGAEFTGRVVEPGLRQLKAVLIAPDCPSPSWSDKAADQVVIALFAEAMREYAIDRQRVLVVGYSMGGRGTWHMASQHQDLFTAAIPMAASTRELSIDRLGRQPTYIIHSRDDEIVPFEPAEQVALELKKLGRPVEFEALDGLTHFEMTSYVDALRDAGRWVAGRWKK